MTQEIFVPEGPLTIDDSYCPHPTELTLDATCNHAFWQVDRKTESVTFQCRECLGKVTFDLWD